MTGFDEYADATREQHEDFMAAVAAGEVVHDRPWTREQAVQHAALDVVRLERFADLYDNDNPDSLWYDGEGER